jgi:hypothetical protein
MLQTTRGVIEQLLLRAGKKEDDDDDAMENDQVSDSGYGTASASVAVTEDEDDVGGPELKRPRMVSDADWNVYRVVDAALRDFNEKFKAMWA